MTSSTRGVRSAAIALMATFAIALQVSAQSPAAVRIENFAKVSDIYYRGGQPAGSDYAGLAHLGVKTVINLIGDSDLDAAEPRAVEREGMRYLRIPMTTRTAPTPQQVETFLSIVNDPASQPVFVHCVGGRHRTGAMTALYRMTIDGWSGDRAFKEMKQFNFGPDFLHPELKRFVYDFDVKRAATAARAGG